MIKTPMRPAASVTATPRFDPGMSSGPAAVTVGTFGGREDDTCDGTARADPATFTRLVLGCGRDPRVVLFGAGTVRAPTARAAFRIP